MVAPKPRTVADALDEAVAYWDANELRTSGRGLGMMQRRAAKCAKLLGMSLKLSSLRPAHGAQLLTSLRASGLARSTVAAHYAACRRMLALSGCPCLTWPKAPTPPRKVRPRITREDVRQCVASLRASEHEDTASLVEFLAATGLRVEVEALHGDAWRIAPGGRMIVVEDGKGGHQRHVPYAEGMPLEDSPEWLGVTYETHLRRIKEASGGKLKPHDLRRFFISEVYERSGKDIRMAQALAGHSDPGTTAGYIGVDPMKEGIKI